MEADQEVHETESVLGVEDVHLPVGVSPWVLVEPRDVLEGSPSLGIISWLGHLSHELREVTIGLLGEGSATSNISPVWITYLPIMSARSFTFGTP